MTLGDVGRRLLVSVDAKGYGGNDGRRQHVLQDRLVRVLDAAATRAGMDRAGWDRQPSGDGEFAVLPGRESEITLVDGFVAGLAAELAAYNRDEELAARLRLRLAIHYGVAVPAPNGYSGQGPVVVGRLVNSAALKRALIACPEAELAVILSPRVFEDTVAQGYTSLPVRMFRKVAVQDKEYDDFGWVYLPGLDVNSVDLTVPASTGGPRAAEPPTPGPTGAGVHNEFHGEVRMRNGFFGIGTQSNHG